MVAKPAMPIEKRSDIVNVLFRPIRCMKNPRGKVESAVPTTADATGNVLNSFVGANSAPTSPPAKTITELTHMTNA